MKLSTQRIVKTEAFQWLQVIIGLVSALPVMFSLANMQLDGFKTLMVATLALTIAFTGLLYNRARAVETRIARFHSIYAAEMALRSTVVTLTAGVFSMLAFPTLFYLGYEPQPVFSEPKQFWPMVCALIVVMPVYVGWMYFLMALKAVFRIDFLETHPQRLRRLLK